MTKHNTRVKLSGFILILLIAIMISCDGGLEPVRKSTISGSITYIGGPSVWPPADSVKEIRVVAFKKYPPENILKEISEKNAFFSDTLPRFVQLSDYYINIPVTPQEFKYIAVAQNYGNLFEWKAIGVYTLTGDHNMPSSVFLNKGESVENVNITVDFSNLPPQPF